jgi:hypothetical protein
MDIGKEAAEPVEYPMPADPRKIPVEQPVPIAVPVPAEPDKVPVKQHVGVMHHEHIESFGGMGHFDNGIEVQP